MQTYIKYIILYLKKKKMHKNNYAKMIFIFNVNLMKRTYIITTTAIN